MRARERPGELLQPGLGSDADGVHGGGEERLEAAVSAPPPLVPAPLARVPSATAKLALICCYYEAIRALIAQLSCLNC